MDSFRIGHGYDVHRLVAGRDLILGGVNIPYEKGLLGHSDADALLHAVMDAVLGALAMGDIGKHFPDTDEKYRGVDSMKLCTACIKSGFPFSVKSCFVCPSVPFMRVPRPAAKITAAVL